MESNVESDWWRNDRQKVIHSGNMEVRGYYDEKAAAEAEADRLNREGGKDED